MTKKLIQDNVLVVDLHQFSELMGFALLAWKALPEEHRKQCPSLGKIFEDAEKMLGEGLKEIVKDTSRHA